jgi:hypothetical protein
VVVKALVLATGKVVFKGTSTVLVSPIQIASADFDENLHAALLSRTVMGNVVVDHEKVTRTFPEGTGSVELIMIYEVQDGRIVKAWSIAGVKRLNDQA